MKTLEEYLKLPYRLEIVPDTEESCYAASYPELPGCISCRETFCSSSSAIISNPPTLRSQK